MSEPNHTRKEEFRVNGEDLLKKVKELIAEGNIRRITIKTKEGKSLLEIPFNIGVVGGTALVVLAPVLAAVGAVAALVTECSIIVERIEPDYKSRPVEGEVVDQHKK